MTSISFDAVIDAPFGKVGIRADAQSVREIVYLPGDVDIIEPRTPLAPFRGAEPRCTQTRLRMYP